MKECYRFQIDWQGVKVETTGGVVEEGRCGDDVVGLLATDRSSVDILPVKKGPRL